MLKPYDYLEIVMKENNIRQRFFETRLNFFASEVMETLNISDENEINASLNRAFQACQSLNISVDKNFKRIYRFTGEDIIIDWKISSLASYLIVINCNPSHENVAKAQLYFAVNRVVQK